MTSIQEFKNYAYHTHKQTKNPTTKKIFHKHWHNMSYTIDRKCLEYAIEDILEQKFSNTFINELNICARMIEEELFNEAENYDDYVNKSTLQYRIQQIMPLLMYKNYLSL